MACALQATLAANSCAFSTRRFSLKQQKISKRSSCMLIVRASSDDSDCNDEECAPEKEVGKVSMEWLAEEKTRVVGTYPPRRKTGYVEKDTAGQTNIYSVEPAVYVAESAISSGNAGSSSDGAENTAAIAAGLALIAIAAASSIILQVGKNTPQVQTAQYSGPSLNYYINKFKPPEISQVSAPSVTEEVSPTPSVQSESSETEGSSSVQLENFPPEEISPSVQSESESSEIEVSSSVQLESSPPKEEVSQVQVESQIQPEDTVS